MLKLGDIGVHTFWKYFRFVVYIMIGRVWYTYVECWDEELLQHPVTAAAINDTFIVSHWRKLPQAHSSPGSPGSPANSAS